MFNLGVVFQMQIAGKELYTTDELVKLIPLSLISIQSYLRKGKIKSIRIGKRYFVSKKNLKKFLDGE